MIFSLLVSAIFAVPPPGTVTADEIIDALARPDGASSSQPQSNTRSLRNLQLRERAIDLNVQFEFDSAKLMPDGRLALQELAKAMHSMRLKDARFLIEGHTDAKGSIDYNLGLSTRRADAVRSFLVSQKVESTRLMVLGKGATELVNKSSPYAAENRRVRIVVREF